MEKLTVGEIQNLVNGLLIHEPGFKIKEPKFELRTDVAAVEVCWGDLVVSRTKCFLVWKDKKCVQYRELRDVPKLISIAKVEVKDGYFSVDFEDGATSDLPLRHLGLQE